MFWCDSLAIEMVLGRIRCYMSHMRTTIDIDDELLKAVKARAADEHRTLKEVFEQALREYLSGPSGVAADAPPIPTFRGKGVQPGVDLTDNAALQAIMASEP